MEPSTDTKESVLLLVGGQEEVRQETSQKISGFSSYRESDFTQNGME